MSKICPFSDGGECREENCQLWLEYGNCAFVVIALELALNLGEVEKKEKSI